MPPRRNKHRRPRPSKPSVPWTQNTGSGFYPSNIPGQVTSMMSPYMQAALGVGTSNMFGMNMGHQRVDYRTHYPNQQMHNPYFRVSKKRSNSEAGMGGGGTSKKRRKAYADQERNDDDDETGYEETDQNQRSELGAKALAKDWKNKNDRQTRYCTVCEVEFIGSFFNHRRHIDHRRNKDKKYPRCRLCRLTFSGVEEFHAHNKTDEHNKMNEDFQVLKKQQLVHADLSDSEGEEETLKKYIANKEPEIITDEGAEPVGTFHLVPLKIYFCKLCQKLFPNYMNGRHIHCRTPAHIQAYKLYFDGKEERAKERSRLKQEEKLEKAKRKRERKAERQLENVDKKGDEGLGEEENSEDCSDVEDPEQDDDKQHLVPEEEAMLQDDDENALQEDDQFVEVDESNSLEEDGEGEEGENYNEGETENQDGEWRQGNVSDHSDVSA